MADGERAALTVAGALAATRDGRSLREGRSSWDGAYARIEAALIARAEGGADGGGLDPVLALNLLKLRRTERGVGEGAVDAEARRVPIAVVQDALLKRLAGIARQEGG